MNRKTYAVVAVWTNEAPTCWKYRTARWAALTAADIELAKQVMLVGLTFADFDPDLDKKPLC